MSIIELEIRSANTQYHIKVDRRINFIMGHSGVGKTYFYDLLERCINRNDEVVKLSSTLPVELVNFGNLSKVNDIRNSIVIVDDLDILSNRDFLSILSKRVKNNLWFIIMSREDMPDEFKTTLTFSTNSIYKLEYDSGKYWLEPLYSFGDNTVFNGDYDCVLIEDSKGGFQFFSKLYEGRCVVKSSNGKDNIISRTNELLSDGYTNILVIFDGASFGSRFEEFVRKFLEVDANVSYISQYECFEELLIRTNLLKDLPEIKDSLYNIEEEANKYNSWEIYFESLVARATSNKPYSYVHKGDLKRCYIDDCGQNGLCSDYKRALCDYNGKDENKIKGLLKGTKYDFLL